MASIVGGVQGLNISSLVVSFHSIPNEFQFVIKKASRMAFWEFSHLHQVLSRHGLRVEEWVSSPQPMGVPMSLFIAAPWLMGMLWW